MKRYTSADVDRIASLQEPQPTTRVMWWVPVVLLITFLFLFGWGARAAETPEVSAAYYRMRDAKRVLQDCWGDEPISTLKSLEATYFAARTEYAKLTGQSTSLKVILSRDREAAAADRAEEEAWEEAYKIRRRLGRR